MSESKVAAVIIDDEINNCQLLSQYIKEYCSEIEILGMAHDAAEAVVLINQEKPQLVFLDIKMPGASGFDVLEALPERNFEVVFVTAFDQYAIKAIRFCAIDYLLKPISVIELQQAVGRVRKKIVSEKSILKEQLDILESNNRSSEKRIALPSMERIRFVKTDDIIRCEGENNYTHVFLVGGEKVLVSRTLKEFEELLVEFGFIRVHQSHLVNQTSISAYEKRDGGYLKLDDGSRIGVSRVRKEQVLAKMASK